MRITETALARQYMTPQSRALFHDTTLDAHLGRATVASALNDQVRFRFDHHGTPSQWKLVPDNQLSEQLLASSAGPKLQQKLAALLASTERADAKSMLNVQGIMLSPTDAAWAAGYELMMRDAGVRPASPREAMETAHVMTSLVSAQSLYGWVQVAPADSRSMLTSLNAYTPARDEQMARSGRYAPFIGPVLRHELEHRITEIPYRRASDAKTYTPVAWIEEGTATLLHMSDARGTASATKAWGVTARQHAGNISAPDVFRTGWKPFRPATTDLSEFSGTTQANYVDSVVTLGSLLRLAGVDVRTNAGRERRLQLLQDVEVRQVPARLAKAILTTHEVRATPERVANLADLIVASNETGGVERVEAFLGRLAR